MNLKIIWFSKKPQQDAPSIPLRSINGYREVTLSLEFDMMVQQIVSVPDWSGLENKPDVMNMFLHQPRRLLMVPTGLLSFLTGPRLILIFDVTSPHNYCKEDMTLLCAPITLKKSSC